MADKYYNRLRETQLGEDLYSYLFHRKSLPEIQYIHWLGPGVRGQYNRDSNRIDVSNSAQNGTITHEMAHAADNALDKQYFDRKHSWQTPEVPTYFTDAYDKLIGGNKNARYQNQRQVMAQRIAPKWFNEQLGYRATNSELGGWGAGRQAGTEDLDYSPPNHLDSTMATELSILMDLARRKDKPFPKQPGLFERLFGK